MHDVCGWDVALNQSLHPRPRHLAFLAASPEGSMPQSGHFVAKPSDGPCISSDAVVLAVPTYHGSQPLAYLGDRVVQTPPQLRFNLLELRPPAITNRVPTHHDPARPARPSTPVHKPQELEGLRLPLPTSTPVLRGMPPKLQQARLVRVHLQPMLPQLLPQGFQVSLGIRPVLEPHDEVVQIAHDDHLTLCFRLSPPLGPHVEHVVQVHVGQQRRDAPSLLGPRPTSRTLP